MIILISPFSLLRFYPSISDDQLVPIDLHAFPKSQLIYGWYNSQLQLSKEMLGLLKQQNVLAIFLVKLHAKSYDIFRPYSRNHGPQMGTFLIYIVQ